MFALGFNPKRFLLFLRSFVSIDCSCRSPSANSNQIRIDFKSTMYHVWIRPHFLKQSPTGVEFKTYTTLRAKTTIGVF
jgi:hypothetical protein